MNLEVEEHRDKHLLLLPHLDAALAESQFIGDQDKIEEEVRAEDASH
jgi:hypothetical protein